MNHESTVAIIGAGPAGCTLAALLKIRGFDVVVFDDDKRPELLVGESLLPTVVPLMRKLGIEDEVSAVSQHKPGVAFVHRDGLRLDFCFPEKQRGNVPNYAYNVPRPAFDNILRRRAEELGVTFVNRRAKIEVGKDLRTNELRLTQSSLDATPQLCGNHPKLLVDSTGRTRLFARTLGIPTRAGSRSDLAYFAHYKKFESGGSRDGQVVISVLKNGWSWRIPLPDRLSVGIVIDKAAAKAHGDSPEERFESIIDAEPQLRDDGQGRERISSVMTYTNYQQISERGFGPGWISCGDAFGFVDPMLSPGLFMAMHMADLLDREAFAPGPAILDSPKKFEKRCAKVMREMKDWHEAWTEIIEYFYDGRIFSMYEAGSQMSELYKKWALPSLAERYMTKHITQAVSGVSTRSRYTRGLIARSSKHLIWGTEPPESYAVR